VLTGSSRGEHDDLTTDASIEGDACAHLSVLSGHPRWPVASSPKWHPETIPWCPGPLTYSEEYETTSPS